ncbi:MAG: 3-carboxy-cis,cis-muconate cycloisomerase [Rhizobium sp.]|nr:3-carboxy-cis,cis-muconate cycloisomerase [Rhizobium sp.]
MALSLLAHHSRLLADEEVADLLGGPADIAAMVAFEGALAKVEASLGLIAAGHAATIREALERFKPDMERLADATLRDGVPVPDLVAQMRAGIGPQTAPFLHFGATSQDVIDTALALKLKPVLALLKRRLDTVDTHLATLIDRFGSEPLMARTRMQAAIMISVGDRLRVWRGMLAEIAATLPAMTDRLLILSLAGAAGTAEKFGDRIGPLRVALAAELGLSVPAGVPHADRDRIADFGSWLSRLTGALGKMGMDIALMAQNGVGQIALSGGGGSSAMPHKQNPVLAEVLVTLARYNATQLAGLHQALVHEQERSGSAWTLEWLILPQMIEAAATALSHATVLLASVERIGEPG